MTADGIPDLYVTDQECYGIFAFFYEVLHGSSHVSIWSIISCVLWGSLIILFYSTLWRNQKFREYTGAQGILILYGACIIQMFLPISSVRQRVIMVPQFLNPVILLFRKKLFGYGSFEVSASTLLLMIWIAGIVVQTVRYVIGHVRSSQQIRRLPKRTLTEAELTAESRMVLPARTKIYRSTGISVPVSYGILQRRILIPDRKYTARELKYIILHESVHLKCRDHITAFLTDILCAVYWWNPCIYRMKRDMEQGMEIRCDSEVVYGMENYEIAEYMSTLLMVFKNRYGECAQNGLAMLGSGNNMREQMRQRFDMLENGRRKTTYGVGIVTAAFGVALMILSNSVNLAPYFPPPVQDMPDAFSDNMDMGVENTYMVGADSYFYQDAAGNYILVNELGESMLAEEIAQVIIADGVPLKAKNVQ